MFRQEGNRLITILGTEKIWVEPWGENSLRVRASRMSEMPQRDWALLPAESSAEITIDGEMARVRNGGIEARMTAGGKLTFFNAKGELLLEEYVRNRKNITREFASALDISAREFKPILGGEYQITARFESDPDEKVFGMGQYQQPFLNIKGCTLELAHRNSQASVPFMISDKGYGFFWHNPAVGSVAFGRNVTTWQAMSTDVLDYWITAGDTPAQLEKQYASVTGTVPMMPDFAMGFWQCKLRYQTQEELMSVAREYHRRGVPVSVIVADFFHWPRQGEWKFDERFWPDPEGMVKELEEMGMKLMVSIWPTVDSNSENFREMEERGLLITTDRGVPVSMTFEGNTIHFDATNPEAREYIWQKAKQNYYDKGVRIFWLDEAEPEYAYYDFDLYRYHLGPNVKVGNVYPRMYAQAFYEGMEKEGQENILNLLRCAWAGSQRYGALVWSGDIHSSFESMRNQFCAGLNMGLAGIPWWTTDIGGFHGGNVNDPAFQELLVRWFQWGAYCPVMRLHGDREPRTEPLTPGVAGGGQLGSGGPNEIWSYGEKNYEIFRHYIEVRESMRPYIKEQMQKAHEDGTPVMRPLFYDFPDDKEAWNVEDAYMFGDRYLVAPVMYAGATSRMVYLPSGAVWREQSTGKLHQGGGYVNADAPLSVIPVFVKE